MTRASTVANDIKSNFNVFERVCEKCKKKTRWVIKDVDKLIQIFNSNNNQNKNKSKFLVHFYIISVFSMRSSWLNNFICCFVYLENPSLSKHSLANGHEPSNEWKNVAMAYFAVWGRIVLNQVKWQKQLFLWTGRQPIDIIVLSHCISVEFLSMINMFVQTGANDLFVKGKAGEVEVTDIQRTRDR